jgi:hypothetical protein
MLRWQGMDLAECLLAPAAHNRQEIQVPTVRPKSTTHKLFTISIQPLRRTMYGTLHLHREYKPAGNNPHAVGILKYVHTIKLVVFY